MSRYAIGLDFGTNSCCALLVNVSSGGELASHVFPYPSGNDDVIIDAAEPDLAGQNPADYILGIEATIQGVIQKGKEIDPEFSPADVIGIGRKFRPIANNHTVYKELYAMYRQLHDAYGTHYGSGQLFHIIKKLLDMRDDVRRSR
jgi:hypothetical protein